MPQHVSPESAAVTERSLRHQWSIQLHRAADQRKRWANECVNSCVDAAVWDRAARRFREEADRVERGGTPRPLDSCGRPKEGVSPTWWEDEVRACADST